MSAKHKFEVGQTVTLADMWRVKIVNLKEWYSETLDMFLPQYEIQTFLGNSGKLDHSKQTVHEHALSMS